MIPFTFDQATHSYRVDGHYTLATSDILAMNGLCDYGSVPAGVLEKARWRGEQLHKCIHYFEEGDLDFNAVPDEVMPYLRAYMKFRTAMDFEPLSMEHALVYQHTGTESMIGATIDLRGFVKGKLYIVDPKCTYPNSGAAKKQTHLRWRLQLQSYFEGTQQDEKFWTGAYDAGATGDLLGRAILHLKKDGSFQESRDFVDFTKTDDEMNWDSAVRLAFLKLGNGYKRPDKKDEVKAYDEEKSFSENCEFLDVAEMIP
jgi:hypothetical protein